MICRCRNQMTSRRRTRSVRAARSADEIGRAGRNATPSGASEATKTSSVTHACRCPAIGSRVSRNGQDGIPARPVAARTAALLVRPHLGCGRTSVSWNGQEGIPARYKDRRPGPCGPGRRRSQSFPIRSRGAWPRGAFARRHHSAPAAQAGSAAQPGSVAQVGSAAQVGSHGTARYTTFGTQRVTV